MDGSALWPRLGRYVPITPTPKQAAFLLLPQMEAFYGGAAGGGKSVALLAAALQYASVPGYSALLVRRSYMELQQPNGLIDLSKRWLGGKDAIWRESDYTWRFPSGATLTFRYLDGRSELAFQGGEYQFIGIDEVTEIEELQYRFLFSRLRRPAGSAIPLRMRAASNPYGPGAEWVRARFVEEGPSRGRVFVRAVFEDNPHLDLPAYEDTLSELPPDVREQLRNGSWEVRTDGGLFRREWFADRTVELPQVPTDLRLCRFWDLAATEAVGGRDPDHTAGVLLGVDRDGIFYILDVVRTRSTPLGVEKLVARTAELDRQLAFQHDLRPVEIRMEQEPGSAGKAIVDVYARRVLQAFDFRGISSTGRRSGERPRCPRAPSGGTCSCSEGPGSASCWTSSARSRMFATTIRSTRSPARTRCSPRERTPGERASTEQRSESRCARAVLTAPCRPCWRRGGVDRDDVGLSIRTRPVAVTLLGVGSEARQREA